MFTENLKPMNNSKSPGTKPVGRPAGKSEKGKQSEQRLYETALRLFAQHGYEQTTLRQIAKEANVSPGLLYKYFSSKQDLILKFHEELSSEYAQQVKYIDFPLWTDRFVAALKINIEVLSPHRDVLKSLLTVLLGPGEEAIFSKKNRSAQQMVEGAFVHVLTHAKDTPKNHIDLAWILYLINLSMIMFWLLDRSEEQEGTKQVIKLLESYKKWASIALLMPMSSSILKRLANISRDSLL